MKIKKILFERNYKAGYTYRRELVDDSEYGGDGNLEMVSCYTPEGDYIGDARMARFLCVKRGLIKLQKRSKTSCICTIGFNEKEQKWHGWSHRAICGFGIKDKFFEEKYGDDNTPYSQHGKKTIRTLTEAKGAALAFAASVS